MRPNHNGENIDLLQKRIAEADDAAAAFKELFNLFSDRLFEFALSYIKSPELAEEIVSDVFVKLWKNRFKLGQIANLTSYLYTATKNQSLTYLHRQKKTYQRGLDEQLASRLTDPSNPEKKMLAQELQQIADKAISELPTHCRATFLLSREEGLSHKEVASVLGVSVNTVETQIGRAIKKLRVKLEGHLNFRIKSKNKRKI